MIKKSFCICLVLFQISLSVFAQKGFQPGYIINHNFDTISGYVNLRSNFLNSKSCEFRQSPDGSVVTYLPSDIFAYRISDSKFYVSREVVIDSVPRKVFLEYLVKGIADLYYLKDLAKEYFFVGKNGILTPLTNEETVITRVEGSDVDQHVKTYATQSERYKGVLRYLFQDSPQALNEVPATRFAYGSLIKLTKDYHNSVCKDWNCVDFTKSSKQQFFVEAVGGFISSTMRVKTSSDVATNSGFIAGAQLRFRPLKAVSRWNFLLGINYSSNDFTGEFSNHMYTWPNTYLIHQEYGILRLPVSAEILFLRKNIKPLIWLTYSNTIILNPDWSIIRTDIVTDVPENSLMRTYQLGVSGGAGIMYSFKNESYLIIRGGYEYRKPAANFGAILDKHSVTSLLFTVGYGFAL